MKTLKQILRRKVAAICLVIIFLIFTAAIFAPWLAPYSPNEQFKDGLTLQGAPIAPNSQYLLGTDLLGRDLLSRLIYGARTSLVVGILANGVALLLGTTIGLVAGYLRGRLGSLIMRVTDLMMAFPALLLAITLAAIFSPSLLIVALVIAMVNWVQVARVIYTQTIAISEREFVEAERAAYMETCIEDDEIAERMDAGRKALLARGDNEVGPYQSPMEDGMQHFHEWYRRQMSAR